MSFEALLTQLFGVERDTADILSSISVSSVLSVTYQPAKVCHLTVEFSGCSVYGQCLITGTDENDNPISDFFNFSLGEDKQQSIRLFKTVVAITTSSFTGGNVHIEGVLRSGEKLLARRAVKSIYARIYTPEAKFSVGVPGAQQTEHNRVMLKKVESDLLKGDYLVYTGGDVYQLKSKIQPMWARSSVHHYEADVERIES